MKYIFREELPQKLNEIFKMIHEKKNELSIREILDTVVKYILSATDQVPYDELVLKIKNTFLKTGEDIMPTIAEQFMKAGELNNSREYIIDILETRFSFVPQTVKTRLDQIENPDRLKQILKFSVTADSIDEFLRIFEDFQ